MIISCSAGHKYDLSTIRGRMDAESRWQGSKRCPMLLHYDRVGGGKYCNRVLKSIEEETDRLYNKMFLARLSGNDKVFQSSKVCKSDGAEKDRQLIRNALTCGSRVKTGYTKTAIRGVRNYYIFILK